MTSIFMPLRLAERGLGYHLRRHELLTSNVANMQTPGYRPLELRFRDVLDAASSVQRTDPRHLSDAAPAGTAAADGAISPDDVYDDGVVAPAPDGNAVSMERQMAKMAANSLRYRATSEMINRRLGLLRYAANDGR